MEYSISKLGNLVICDLARRVMAGDPFLLFIMVSIFTGDWLRFALSIFILDLRLNICENSFFQFLFLYVSALHNDYTYWVLLVNVHNTSQFFFSIPFPVLFPRLLIPLENKSIFLLHIIYLSFSLYILGFFFKHK